MFRALRIGLFLGTLIGMSACATLSDGSPGTGAYGGAEVGRSH